MTIPSIPTPNVTRGNWGETFLTATTPRAAGIAIYNYGASYSTLNQAYHTVNQHWTELLAAELGSTVQPVSYGVNGRRCVDVASALLEDAGGHTGITGIVAGAQWPGTSSRTGLIVHDALGNDFMNEASHVDALTVVGFTAGSTYEAYLKQTWRAALAVMCTETRIENHSHSATSGVWTHSSTATWPSGGETCFTTANAAYAEYSVTPAQSGPLAGKVWIIIHGDIPTANVHSSFDVSVDGGGATSYTTARNNYIGINGVEVKAVIQAVPVTLPVNGAAHTVRITHTGTAGHYLIIDCLLVPSVDPNPILCMGTETSPVVHASGLDSGDLALYKQNVIVGTAAYQDVAAEFPNAIYVPSTMTSNGIYSGDGLHPNDRGMRQRAGDAAIALRDVLPRLRSRALSLESDGSFGVV